MRRHGQTVARSQRWYCPSCQTTATRKRPDIKARASQQAFTDWLTTSKGLADLAKEKGVSLRTIARRWRDCWQTLPQPCPIKTLEYQTLVLDAVYVEGRKMALMIARTKETIVSWQFVPRENLEYWLHFLSTLPIPFAVVCDGQRGLLGALNRLWPKTKIQRCLIHVIRLAKSRITKQPRTKAGQELRLLVSALGEVWTSKQKRSWLKLFWRWWNRYQPLLKERSYASNKRNWWYTHKHLRSAAVLIKNSLPDLFTYTKYRYIPRTTNLLEGGINSRLKDLIRRHRGMKLSHKQIMLAHYLKQRQTKNNTLFVY